jgi:hypothetical protein
MAENFSLFGGPVHRWTRRWGSTGSPVAFGVVLGATLWVVLMAVAFADGVLGQLFTLSRLSGHVRLLVVIPLLFWAEALVEPRIASWVQSLPRSGVVPDTARAAFDTLLARIARVRDSWMPDAICLGLAVTVALTATHLPLVGETAGADPSRGARMGAAALWWYWIGCLTLFRFLLVRWIWRLALWAYLLSRIARLDLHLVPTHPDYAAGLGGLHQVQLHFVPLVLAISVVQSASLAEELSAGLVTLQGILPGVVVVAAVDAILFGGPPLFFLPVLWRTRVTGLQAYMQLGSEYVRTFERKWVEGPRPVDEPLVGTPDLQSLADLTNSLVVVRNLRMVPVVSQKLLFALGMAAVLPLVPLLLFEYPLVDLAARFLSRLTGF